LIQNAAVDSGSQVFRCSLFCIGTILIIHRYLCVKGEAADHADGIRSAARIIRLIARQRHGGGLHRMA
jgi:hypothetical protein